MFNNKVFNNYNYKNKQDRNVVKIFIKYKILINCNNLQRFFENIKLTTF